MNDVNGEANVLFTMNVSPGKASKLPITLKRANNSNDVILTVWDDIQDGKEHRLAEVHISRRDLLEHLHP